MKTISIIKPDDFHLHLRDGEMMAAVVPYSSHIFGRAIVMPNLVPPITGIGMAEEYRRRIISAIPKEHDFTPLMTCYMTDKTNPDMIYNAHATKSIYAVKYFPAGATTNSDNGVTNIENIYDVLNVMQKNDIPLSVHGESTNPAIDIFDREAAFIEETLIPVRKKFPDLKIIFEHLTSKIAVDYVLSENDKTVATITPHHLVLTRNDIFKSGINPNMYCLPIAKTAEDRESLIKAATSGNPKFFFGTDSAPHPSANKIKAGGAAGIFNAPVSMGYVTQIFDDFDALDKLEGFTSIHGANFYGLPLNNSNVTLIKREKPIEMQWHVDVDGDQVKIFKPDTPLYWELVN